MTILLSNKNIKLEINEKGAFIDSFVFKEDEILYPRFLVNIGGEMKPRGGMHICLPNFGKSDICNLEVHGFGRDLDWEIEEKYDDKIKLRLDGIDMYEKMYSYIDYVILDDGFETLLKIENKSDKNLLIAPAFHPYFNIVNSYKTNIDNLSEKILNETYFYDENTIQIMANNHKINISCDNFNVFALWTDDIKKYLCIEPTYNGNSFIKEKNNPYVLKPQEIFEARMLIRII